MRKAAEADAGLGGGDGGGLGGGDGSCAFANKKNPFPPPPLLVLKEDSEDLSPTLLSKLPPKNINAIIKTIFIAKFLLFVV